MTYAPPKLGSHGVSFLRMNVFRNLRQCVRMELAPVVFFVNEAAGRMLGRLETLVLTPRRSSKSIAPSNYLHVSRMHAR